MDSQHAKEILMRYRPGSTGEPDPDLAQAFEQIERDPDLARWFDQHRAFQATVADRFKNLPLPAGLKDKILAGYRPARVVPWKEWSIYPALAAAAALVLLVSLAYLGSRPREDQSFAAYRNRVVRHAQRGYAMDIISTNLHEIRQYLASHNARADYALPAALEKLPGDGGAVLRWHNKTVSMVCFALGNRQDLYLFVASRADLPDAPPGNQPQFTRIGRLTAASWCEGDKSYVLAGPGDPEFLRAYLR